MAKGRLGLEDYRIIQDRLLREEFESATAGESERGVEMDLFS